MNWYSHSGIVFVLNRPTLCCCECRQIESFSSDSRAEGKKEKENDLIGKTCTFLKPTGTECLETCKNKHSTGSLESHDHRPKIKAKRSYLFKENMSSTWERRDWRYVAALWRSWPQSCRSPGWFDCVSVSSYTSLTLTGIILKPRGRRFVKELFFLSDLTLLHFVFLAAEQTTGLLSYHIIYTYLLMSCQTSPSSTCSREETPLTCRH